MPDLDVSEVLSSHMLADDFVVERRATTVDTNGRSQIAADPRLINAFGVVQAVAPDQLERGPDEQHMEKTISVVTNTRLQGPAEGYQADVVRWSGGRYLVTNVGDYSRYGEGFVVATASSMESMDLPPSS